MTTEINRKLGHDVQPDKQIDTDLFFSKVKEGIKKEKEAKRDEIRNSISHNNITDVISTFGGVKNAKPFTTDKSKNYEKYTFKIDSIDNIVEECGIYPNNEVVISIEKSGLAQSTARLNDTDLIEAEAVDITGDSITISVYETRSSKTALEVFRQTFGSNGSRYAIVPLLNSVPYDRVKRAVNEIKSNDLKRDILTGNKTLEFSDKQDIQPPDELNQSQKEAFSRSIRSKEISLIHGPPGTGKSKTLSEIVRAYAPEKTVLLTAHSNQAVDNLIMGSSQYYSADEDSLHHDALYDEFTISRVGSGSKNDVIKANYSDVNASNADVIAGTMNSIEKFDPNTFDVAVVDESSQAPIHSSMIPLAKSKKTIFAGDHKQLPPYSSKENEQKDIEISLFEHFILTYGARIKTFLHTQYRMNEKIARFPSEEFYDGDLRTATNNHDWTVFNLDPIRAFDVGGVEEETERKSYKNTSEIAVICDKIQALDQLGVDLSSVGVIAAYNGQVKALKESMSRIDGPTNEIKIDTIDSFQGSEKEIIFVSFVRSNEDGDSGFLTYPGEGGRRLNVAMTRAKKRLVLVGNFDTLREETYEEDCSDIYERLYEYLSSIGSVVDMND